MKTISNLFQGTKTPAIPQLKINPALPPEEFTNLLVQRLEGLNLESDTSAVEHHMILDLWDFAGQHLYYTCYPVFLSSRAVYLLVYNLNKGLNEKALPCFRRGLFDIHLNNASDETNLENLLSWLVTVSSSRFWSPSVIICYKGEAHHKSYFRMHLLYYYFLLETFSITHYHYK